ncbi:DNA mismatch repair endonuclease MutL [Vagococcus zengguangii]|uniref:DNA mismatch repair protein MutL n=1 Tax=Vagococcus zengguangii TaxID=2571750 RepID=A0A4D7CNI4_9ENTE|nr:DNA mismatch repair endonuclease MutL [Vagococcus zengguangii]QCI85648.1 DNA mismatch repair endonuclease MutL [Vagococcus zengguangii]TLG81588.1 DNA mismatch repair endonuclease MutL [Vagococcus zengguangii]
MSKIQELSEQLANQIAAGEVVERPASVVKELVENAIDAGSTQIDINLEEAGLKKIQVIDNGEGIAADDVLNAFKRHATSKILTQDDLFRIKTLGFRGEALPSIASVSRFTLETSTGEEEGSYVYLEGGKVKEHKPHSLRKGTNITVADLFYNTPARLKYVKTLQTELSNIVDLLNRLAMSHPNIAFRLVHDGNQMLRTTGNGDLKQAIAGIYGVSTAKKMLAVAGEDLDFKVSGYVSLPELTRAGRQYISIIINGRYIRNFALNKAIIAGYGSKLMVGRYPIAVLQIEMDPLLVDVNVHPTKQEVRLSKEPELMHLIETSIKAVFEEQRLVPQVDTKDIFKKKVPKEKPVEQLSLTSEEVQARLNELKSSANSVTSPMEQPLRSATIGKTGLTYDATSGRFYVDKQKVANDVPPVVAEPNTLLAEVEAESTPIVPTSPTKIHKPTVHSTSMGSGIVDIAHVSLEKLAQPFGEEVAIESKHVTSEPPVLELTDVNEPTKKAFPHLEYFGQMHGTYLFAQSEEGLFIVDQHAAQERIKYEYYREKIGDVGSDLQELLIPIVLEYPRSDLLKIQEKESLLQEVGIHLEAFGSNSFIVRSHPTWYPKGEEEAIIREMIETLLHTGKVSVAKFREDTAIMMSCKKSIKANHHLEPNQARQLLEDLAKCQNPYNCPHGRPVLVHFTNKEMEKMFKRIQDPH